MTERKVQTTQSLRMEPRGASGVVVSPAGDTLQVQAGETVKTGAKDSVDETIGERKVTWVFVEATGGQFVDLRKGYVSNGALVPLEVAVDTSRGHQGLQEEVERKSFATACYLQAAQDKANPAYLYASAFALSGEQWQPNVKASAPAGALGFGPFRFSTEAWQSLISEPEAAGLRADHIRFPNAQCIVAAIVASKSASLLKGLVTDRSLTAVDLFLAHLFADNNSFGSNGAAGLLQARRDSKDKSCEVALAAEVYPDAAVRSAFFKRNADIFKEDGSATVEQALAVCTDKLKAGFAEAGKIAKELEDCEAEVFESGIPSALSGAILGDGTPGREAAGAGIGGGVLETQQKATRRLPISPQLHDILEYAGRMTAIDVDVYSGGQPPTGPNRTGSHRHDVGGGRTGAADLIMRDAKSGRTLDSDNMRDRARIAAFITEAAAAGAIGCGHAPGYMGSTRTHIGGGNPEAVWGAGATRSGAPAWVIEAFAKGRARALTSAQVADALTRMRQTPGATEVAGSGGGGGGGGGGADDVNVLAGVRRRFAGEVSNPGIRRLIAASTAAEVGGQGEKAAQYYIESVFNRAAARDKSIASTVTDSRYYPDTTLNKLNNPVAAADQARIDKIIDDVMAGANESNLATGNESGPVHSGGAPVTRDLGPRKERFVRELPDSRWIRKVEAALMTGVDVA